LRHGHFKLLICVINPGMTANHQLKDGLDKTSDIEALGSVHSYISEGRFILRAAHFHFFKSDLPPDGSTEYSFPADFRNDQDAPIECQIDPIAVQAFQNMVLSMRRQGAAIVYVESPLYEPYFEANKTGREAYTNQIRSMLTPAPFINFDGPEYASFRTDPTNFYDGRHPSIKGAREFSALLEQLIPQAIASAPQAEAPHALNAPRQAQRTARL